MWTYEKAHVRGRLAWGRVSLDLQGVEREGRCFYSDRIEVGLKGESLRLFFAQADSAGYDDGLLAGERVIFGDPDVFAQSSYVPGIPAAKLGAWMDPAEGVFVLGVRLQSHAVRTRLTICWWAESAAEPETPGQPEAAVPGAEEFYINNMPKMMKPGMKFQFSCVKPEGTDVRWQVLSPEGGEINQYGLYTAPEQPGIYQIRATLGDGRETSIYLIVK